MTMYISVSKLQVRKKTSYIIRSRYGYLYQIHEKWRYKQLKIEYKDMKLTWFLLLRQTGTFVSLTKIIIIRSPARRHQNNLWESFFTFFRTRHTKFRFGSIWCSVPDRWLRLMRFLSYENHRIIRSKKYTNWIPINISFCDLHYQVRLPWLLKSQDRSMDDLMKNYGIRYIKSSESRMISLIFTVIEDSFTIENIQYHRLKIWWTSSRNLLNHLTCTTREWELESLTTVRYLANPSRIMISRVSIRRVQHRQWCLIRITFISSENRQARYNQLGLVTDKQIGNVQWRTIWREMSNPMFEKISDVRGYHYSRG